jgi:hypothetical protein
MSDHNIMYERRARRFWADISRNRQMPERGIGLRKTNPTQSAERRESRDRENFDAASARMC